MLLDCISVTRSFKMAQGFVSVPHLGRKMAEDVFTMATRWLMMELSWPPDGSSWRQVGPSWRSIGLKILMLKPSCGEVKTKCVLCILLGPSWGLSCGSSWPQMASRRSQDGRKLLARRSCNAHAYFPVSCHKTQGVPSFPVLLQKPEARHSLFFVV